LILIAPHILNIYIYFFVPQFLCNYIIQDEQQLIGMGTGMKETKHNKNTQKNKIFFLSLENDYHYLAYFMKLVLRFF
jgi:hypothetical protein